MAKINQPVAILFSFAVKQLRDEGLTAQEISDLFRVETVKAALALIEAMDAAKKESKT